MTEAHEDQATAAEPVEIRRNAVEAMGAEPHRLGGDQHPRRVIGHVGAHGRGTKRCTDQLGQVRFAAPFHFPLPQLPAFSASPALVLPTRVRSGRRISSATVTPMIESDGVRSKKIPNEPREIVMV